MPQAGQPGRTRNRQRVMAPPREVTEMPHRCAGAAPGVDARDGEYQAGTRAVR
ncbi:hypothetical protein GCM10012319_01570 [Comamonas sp. KCTC 72670]|nr:hypothetical protein GCM10012319_01570 [Comamonas sp. KCTC 72670]